ncbi:hypothetical protein TD95_001758 [Thielaviopsis punctulata]|uniref:Microbial-type PARG catalytic domain-containing protein n=1 Tax=Thielaviopsis punctulata TaxID=72032 RepID=A0A0F4Z8A1_9PEZI|nr:hypothetical protein TD95_001758 [Thielaviopsis punctulata]
MSQPQPQPKRPAGPKRTANLQAVAYNTKHLPALVAQRTDIDTAASVCYTPQTALPPLDPAKSPRHPLSTVSVWNDDTVTAALRLDAIVHQARADIAAAPASAAHQPAPGPRVAIVNFANAMTPGGGYIGGATAQEEAICYRSSLYFSLQRASYPWASEHVLYTRDVLVHRGDSRVGMPLLMDLDPKMTVHDLPVISAVSVAAEINPMQNSLKGAPGESGHRIPKAQVFAKAEDRDLYKTKVRMVLRAMGHNGHSALILGALGCGVFANPAHDAALCWREVLEEKEFRGWFSHVWFAIMGDVGANSNFHIFSEYLAGIYV